MGPAIQNPIELIQAWVIININFGSILILIANQ